MQWWSNVPLSSFEREFHIWHMDANTHYSFWKLSYVHHFAHCRYLNEKKCT
jgi:hypothetical protein